MRRDAYGHLIGDILIIIVSIVIAFYLIQSGIITTLLRLSEHAGPLGSFFVGVFFTSVFTTAPAIAAFTQITKTEPLLITAAVGAVGAVIGDLVIFSFIRDRFSEHLAAVFKHRRGFRRFHALSKLKILRYMTFFLGGIIIASPLHDELGISLLGFSKMRWAWFIPLSFAFNFLGILAIGLVSRAL